MLQQTQVDRVVPKFSSFVKKFPSFEVLARAPLKKVLVEWQGLGYNRRALNMKRMAETVVQKHSGRLPRDTHDLLKLPGIGPYTAGALRAFVFNEPDVFIETNIRTVFIHHFPPKAGRSSQKIHDKELLPFIAKTLDTKNPREWYYALMDYGAWLKTQTANPNYRSAHYAKQSPFRGSQRELRGQVVKAFLDKTHTRESLARTLGATQVKLKPALRQLEQDGLIQKSGRRFRVAL
jgi:A/G-specific adenine glycosylase